MVKMMSDQQESKDNDQKEDLKMTRTTKKKI